MIKYIYIKNFKLFKEEVKISFANHRSQSYGLDYIVGGEDNISSVAGILGKNASGKSSVLKAIKIYAKFSSKDLKKDLLENEYIQQTIKELNKSKIEIKKSQKVFEKVLDNINKGEFPEDLGENAIANHIDWFTENAFSEDKPITIKVVYMEKGQEIFHQMDINIKDIEESIIVKNEVVHKQINKLIEFTSKLPKIMEQNSIEMTKLVYLNHNYSSKNKLSIKENIRNDFLNFIKITDETVQEIFYTKNGNISSYIDSRSGKKIDSKYLSSGTKHMMWIFLDLFKAIKKRKSFLIIDEIENSLHLQLVKFIITIFKKSYNKKNSQLLFTTHNPLIFDQDFKKNSIHFIDNFKIVKNNMRFDKKITPGYLKGELISNPEYKYRFNFLDRIADDE